MAIFFKSKVHPKFKSDKNKPIIALGSMSGTSLDGLDLCLVSFTPPITIKSKWRFSILASSCIPYKNTRWASDLPKAYTAVDNDLSKISKDYAIWISLMASQFLKSMPRSTPKAEAFCSHGHTVRHEPQKGVSIQIGNTYELTTHLDIPIVCDFRINDIRRGGQGAPLVPLADMFLFSNHSTCLNLGGFSNASWSKKGVRLAADLGPCNIISNELMSKIGKSYDNKGEMASAGVVNIKIFESLKHLPYYSLPLPKSLSREWAVANIYEKIFNIPKIEDAVATSTEHSAWAIGHGLKKNINKNIFLSGGGVWNTYLVDRIKFYTKKTIEIPEKQIVEQKESLSFAFLGIKRLRGEINVLSSVTGSKEDGCDGTVFEKTFQV
ncbi:MAG: Anhydro-N-acetylmuramic acid kinase [Owenweeksia sp. TMED14]|nr:MAG: Anhydro-N-acetylmuramic acid kinase [Owenweeksia sp. TMED14]|tara:strand:+ start:275 stop:1414 length:1140 start_codon:yes stop_codon:yes gene_type:complete